MHVPALRILAALSVAFVFTACKTAPKSTESKPAAPAASAPAQPAAKVAPADPAKPAAKPAASSSSASSNDGAATLTNLVTCKSGSDERTLEISKKDEGCAVHYTKFGEAQEIGAAQADQTFCQKLVDKVRDNLEAAGFTCK